MRDFFRNLSKGKKEYSEEEVRLIIDVSVKEEREECAKVCDLKAIEHKWEGCYADECATAIRNRGK